MIKLLNLIIGGSLGTLARYFLSGVCYQFLGAQFPYGTLIVNLFGCLVVGFLASISDEKFFLDSNSRLFLMAGFCGAFTTFSTFIFVEAFKTPIFSLVSNGNPIQLFSDSSPPIGKDIILLSQNFRL